MNTLALLPNLAGPDMIIIFVIVLIMFGAKKLPEFAKGLGQAVREFSKAKDNVNQELHNASHAIESTIYHPPIETQAVPVSPAPVSLHKTADPVPATAAAQTAHPVPHQPEPTVVHQPQAAQPVAQSQASAPVAPVASATPIPEALKPRV
jgi:sec-independent protein translocase protein TatA